MDNNQIFHVDENIVSQVISDIEEKCGKISVTHRNDLVFLDMNIIFNEERYCYCHDEEIS